MAQRTLHYSIVDVFAESALQGNPLAVFHDARSLSTGEMQALARETNLAETTFVLPEDDESGGVRVRIFTTQEELPFAGHPTLGTASWLYWNHATLRGSESITLRLQGGAIAVVFEREAGVSAFAGADAGAAGVVGRMRQRDPVFGTTHSRSAVASALGLAVEDLSEAHAPQTVSTGLPFCIVPLRDLEAASRLSIAQREAQRYLDNCDAKFFYCIAPTGNNDTGSDSGKRAAWHARMQFYTGEDPATGSAAGCAAAWLVQQGLASADTPFMIEQGVEIQRASRITVQASLCERRVTDVLVSGRTIPVAEGRFFLP